jgi:hypothetical protein
MNEPPNSAGDEIQLPRGERVDQLRNLASKPYALPMKWRSRLFDYQCQSGRFNGY